MKTFIRILIPVFCIVIISSAAFAARYCVKPGGNDEDDGTSWTTAFATLTKAADAVTSGDEVWVAGGTYLTGTKITIKEGVSFYGGFWGIENLRDQRVPESMPTIIEGQGYGITCVHNYGLLDGFHVTGGKQSGIYNTASGIVSQCQIYNNLNDFSGWGGGIHNYEGIVTHCIVYGNQAIAPYGYPIPPGSSGGGIRNVGNGIVIHCIVYDNHAIAPDYGDLTGSSSGGGIVNTGTGGKIVGCVVYNNSADNGGGISNMGEVINCTVYSNDCNKTDTIGGIRNSGTVLNSISWYNENWDISGGMIRYCCYSNAVDGVGNFSTDPLFVTPWNFHLKNGSPCIDAGTLVGAPGEDIEGNAIPGADGKVCIGAYESPDDYTPFPPKPSIRIHVSKNGNNTNGNSWEDAYTSITMALSSIDDNFYEIWVSEGTYQERNTIYIPERVKLYGGFAGTETSLEQRIISEHPAIIDGEGKYRCVKISGTIDGFHVTNGYDDYSGGGIFNEVGIVANCILYFNSAERDGGGIVNKYGKVTCCTLYSNSSYYKGGGIYNDSGSVICCTLYSNSAARYVSPDITEGDGGGIYNVGGTVDNCILYLNSANMERGGIYNNGGNIFNSTLFNNSGGIYGSGNVMNSICWENGSSDIYGGKIYYSCFKEATAINGNINSDPLFKNMSGDWYTWDFHLQDSSPCIDAGNPDEIYNDCCLPPGKGELRNDMGAYGGPENCREFLSTPPPMPTPTPTPTSTPYFNPTVFYVKPTGEDSHEGTSWNEAFATLSKAVGVAIKGDEVWVAKGTYSEGKEITIAEGVSFYGGFSGSESSLEERNISENPTTINGENKHRCVYNYGIIDGFNVTNGHGGGIFNSYGTVANCNIYFNFAYYTGGGIYNEGGTVKNCILHHNSTDYSYYHEYNFFTYGGGIYNISGIIDTCILYSNTSEVGGGILNKNGVVKNSILYENSSRGYDKVAAGGIYNSGGTIDHCTLYSNTAQNWAGGIYNSSGSITNCTLYSNSAEQDGGGILIISGNISNCILYSNSEGIDNYQGTVTNCILYSNSEGIENYQGTVTNCTLYSNSGGISNKLGNVTNCIIYSNTGGISNDSGNVANCSLFANSSGISNNKGTVINCTVYSSDGYGIQNQYGTITNCISWKNGSMDISSTSYQDIYFSCYSEACSENGNIKCNPLFMNTSGDPSTWDLHLQNGSPCVDSGTTDTAQLPDKDIEGNARPGEDGKVCMGAYESPDNYTPSPPGPISRVYVSNTGNNTNGSSWENAYIYISTAIASIDDNIHEIWVREWIDQEWKTIVVPGRVILYGGFAGTETSLEQRNISEHPTTLYTDYTYRSFYNYGTIDGFHLSSLPNGYSGGGIHNKSGTIKNCTFYSNSNDKGGGIYNDLGTVTNCILYSNISSGNGGGIYNNFGTVSNCILYSNSAHSNGGGIYNSYGTVKNCIIHSNSAKYGDGGGIYNYGGYVYSSTIYSNSGYKIGGIANCGIIKNCISWNNKICDISGSPNLIYSSCFGESWEINGNIKGNPLFMNTSGEYSTWDLHLQNGSPCIDTGILEDAPEQDIEGNPRPGEDGKVCMGAYESSDYYTPLPPQPPSRIYVSKNGNNTNGGSWEDAYTSITSALSSISGDNIFEIWVREGIYLEPSTFLLVGRVGFYGGFAGTESSLEERNISEHPTIIDKSIIYRTRCIYNYGTIDGFHITNGYYSGSSGGGGIYNDYGTVTNCILYSNWAYYNGGGIFNNSGMITNCTLYSNSVADLRGGGIYNNCGTVANCILYSNSASSGGGIYNNNGTVTNVILYSNSVKSSGGGIYNNYGSVTNCNLYSNTSDVYGGGISNVQGTISNCILYSNSSNNGGGIFNDHGTVNNCTLLSNFASYGGGGIYNNFDGGFISNCIINFNDAGNYGGGIFNRNMNDYDNSIIYNCILFSNSNWGIYNRENGNIYNCTVFNNQGGIYSSIFSNIENCISWQNQETDIEAETVSYSCFKEATGSDGNINADPLFIKTDGSPSGWIFQVKNGSPCIDAGNPDASYNDACFPPGKGAIRCDMGAYGGPYNCNWGITIQKNDLIDFLTGKRILYNLQFPFADINADDKVDIADLMNLIQPLSSPDSKSP